MSVVAIHGLVRRFGATRVLAGLHLDVEPGEHVAITGPNGSGKTTLLRVLMGLLRPTAGDVRVLGGSTDDPRIRRRIGIVCHASSLYPRMTAVENIRFWGRLYEDPGALDRGRELLGAVGLDPHDPRPVATYSQGMRQRAAAVRALCTDPELLLADEPLAGLDTQGARAVSMLLSHERTIIVATHDPSTIGGTRCLTLHGGQLHET